MKFALLIAIVSVLGCASSKSPGMPDRVGGLLGAKVEDGPCLETGVILFFFPDATSDQGAAFQLEKGCRCSYRVNGVEYMPTQTFPQEMCEAFKLKKIKEKEHSGEQSGTQQPAEPTSYGL